MASATIQGWGYEGKTLADLIADAQAVGARAVVDIRLTPISRKKGFSKTRLREAVEEAGMIYLHYRSLGNPKDNRAAFAHPGSEAAVEAYTRFRTEVLETDEGKVAVHELAELASGGVILVLCYEADHSQCHRRLVIDEVKRLLTSGYQNMPGSGAV